MASFDGWTPLLKATQKMYHGIMGALLKHGANPKAKLIGNQYTALHLACEAGDLDGVKILGKHGGCEFQAQTKDKLTPLELTRKLLDESQGSSGAREYQEIFNFL
jgi:ankyrin repeat protein